MSLPLPALLAALANAQANEVAPALQLLGQAEAPDANYAGGTAATSAAQLMHRSCKFLLAMAIHASEF